MNTIEAEVGSQSSNELTLPEDVMRSLGLRPGDRVVFEVDDAHPGSVRLRPIRRSYAGLLAGVYGSPGEVDDYIRGERASWSE
jgi:antitoxin component of MazEF toxin-antitoxin module